MASTALKETNKALSVSQLKKSLAEEAEKIELINQYISDNLKVNTDYGLAWASAKKPSLLKAGAEKICSLLNLEATFDKDTETLAHLKAKYRDKTILLRCRLISRHSGMQVAEGFGAYQFGERDGKSGINALSHNVNTAMKMAKKRALIDATLTIASLSDRFTQDEPPEAEKGKDQTTEVLDAMRECKNLTAYRKLVHAVNNNQYMISKVGMDEFKRFSAIKRKELMMQSDEGGIEENELSPVDRTVITIGEFEKKEDLAVFYRDLQEDKPELADHESVKMAYANKMAKLNSITVKKS